MYYLFLSEDSVFISDHECNNVFYHTEDLDEANYLKEFCNSPELINSYIKYYVKSLALNNKNMEMQKVLVSRNPDKDGRRDLMIRIADSEDDESFYPDYYAEVLLSSSAIIVQDLYDNLDRASKGLTDRVVLLSDVFNGKSSYHSLEKYLLLDVIDSSRVYAIVQNCKTMERNIVSLGYMVKDGCPIYLGLPNPDLMIIRRSSDLDSLLDYL